jgi:hypothetical protein
MPVETGIQVTDSVRYTVEKRYPGGWWVWIPDFTGMTERKISLTAYRHSLYMSQRW